MEYHKGCSLRLRMSNRYIIHSIMSPSKVSWWNSNNNSGHVVVSHYIKETCLSPFHNSIDSGVIVEM